MRLLRPRRVLAAPTALQPGDRRFATRGRPVPAIAGGTGRALTLTAPSALSFVPSSCPAVNRCCKARRCGAVRNLLRDRGPLPRVARRESRDRARAPRRLLEKGQWKTLDRLAAGARPGALLWLDRRAPEIARRGRLHHPLHA